MSPRGRPAEVAHPRSTAVSRRARRGPGRCRPGRRAFPTTTGPPAGSGGRPMRSSPARGSGRYGSGAIHGDMRMSRGPGGQQCPASPGAAAARASTPPQIPVGRRAADPGSRQPAGPAGCHRQPAQQHRLPVPTKQERKQRGDRRAPPLFWACGGCAIPNHYLAAISSPAVTADAADVWPTPSAAAVGAGTPNRGLRPGPAVEGGR
jgi:hypothetical protein